MWTRRSLLGALPGALCAASTERRPNIVLIVGDDLGRGDVACFGAERDPLTPNIDRLAREGVKLTHFYANAPSCSPTRAALLTGRHPYRCGVPLVVDSAPGVRGLPGSEITIADLLRGAGYRTGLIGKWHLGSAPESLPGAHGFDDFFGFRSGCVDYYSHRFYWGLGAGLPSFHDLWRNDVEIDASGEYATTLITRESIRFIEENRSRPFFLTVAYNAPHYPMHAPERYRRRFPDLEPERALHLAMTAAMDDGVGEIVQALDRLGPRRDTVVVFISDNGATIEDRAGRGGRNTPFRGYKFSLFEGGVRVPAVVRSPGRVPAGRTRDQIASAMDLFTTFAGLAGAPIPRDRVIDGRDLWPMIVSDSPSPVESLFWKRYDQTAVRRGDWKLVRNGILALGEENRLEGDDRLFLSNLKDDPGESHNLARKRPDKADELTLLARRWELDVAPDG